MHPRTHSICIGEVSAQQPACLPVSLLKQRCVQVPALAWLPGCPSQPESCRSTAGCSACQRDWLLPCCQGLGREHVSLGPTAAQADEGQLGVRRLAPAPARRALCTWLARLILQHDVRLLWQRTKCNHAAAASGKEHSMPAHPCTHRAVERCGSPVVLGIGACRIWGAAAQRAHCVRPVPIRIAASCQLHIQPGLPYTDSGRKLVAVWRSRTAP